MVSRKEVMGICQVSRNTWMKHEFEGHFKNQANYTFEEAYQVIKYFRYAGTKRRSSTDYSRGKLATLCGVSCHTIDRYLRQGLIPAQDKRFGTRQVWSYDLAQAIALNTKFGMGISEKAKTQGYFSITETARMIDIPYKTFRYHLTVSKTIPKPTNKYGKRLYYDTGDIEAINDILKRTYTPQSNRAIG